MSKLLDTATAPAPDTSLPAGYEKRLMLTAGRASRELAGKKTKSRTTIGDAVKTGVDTMFVAPVDVGDGAYTAAGSVITEDVPPGALAVSRPAQKNIEGYAERLEKESGDGKP